LAVEPSAEGSGLQAVNGQRSTVDGRRSTVKG
jgi:hypothetical protein